MKMERGKGQRHRTLIDSLFCLWAPSVLKKVGKKKKKE